MISKLSLFDFFAMLIPGGIIMATICPYLNCVMPICTEELCCCCKVIVDDEFPAWMWLVLTVVAYLIGLINNWIADGAFRIFRNDRRMIDNELLRVVRSNGVIHLDKFGGNRYVNSKESSLCLICAVQLSFKNVIRGFCPDCKHQHRNHVEYYKAYYCLSRHNLLGGVSIIEAQVALIRNCLIPILLFTVFEHCLSCECVIAIVIMLAALFIVMVQRQNKIYRMIWEAANYYEL